MKKNLKTLLVIAALIASMGLAFSGLAQIPGLPKVPGVPKVPDKVNKAVETGKKVVDASKPWTYPEERATGRVLAAKVAASFGGLWNDPAWTKYVNEVGRSLVYYSKRNDIKYRFAILNTNDVNAYSCPGGYIFVTKGLLKQLDSEAQLAGVLAHEIAHVSQRHIENAVKNQKVASTLLSAGMDFAASDGALTADQANLIKQLGDLSWEILISKGLDKQDEFEADRVGTENIYKMGYSPNGVIAVLKKLQALEGDKSGPMKVLLSTHPVPSKRIDELKKFIAEKAWNVEGRPTLAERFMNFKNQHPIQ